MNLMDLGEDFLYLIITYLNVTSPSSLFVLAQVSKALNNLTIPVLYRSIELCATGENIHRKRQLVECMLEEKHEMKHT
jgi:hypothetical protein